MILLALLAQPGWGRPARDWSKTAHFAYQLQKVDLPALAASPFDLLIIDYSRDGSEGGEWTRAQIAALQGASGRRLVLSYLSIGEAENYRFYWQKGFQRGKPSWLDSVNPDWAGNFKVHYWEPGWRAIIHAYLDRIMAAGFDGVYLDLIDSYEFYEGKGRKQARAEMIALVQEIASYSRSRAGADFGIFSQNGDDLLSDPAYLRCLTGIGREDLYFGQNGEGVPSDKAFTAEHEANLNRALKAGKLVLNVDYARQIKQIRQAHRRARSHHYLEFVGTRKLDELPIYPGIQP